MEPIHFSLLASMVTAEPLTALSISSTFEERTARYKLLYSRLKLILEGKGPLHCALYTNFDYLTLLCRHCLAATV